VADLLALGADFLAGQLAAHASVPVTYTRVVAGVTQSAALSATPTDTLLRLSDGFGGAVIQRTDRDFIFRASALVLGGQPATPKAGDQVREVVGSATQVYEVRHPANESVWRYEDNARTLIRVFTKHVRTE
jgi:hypothetical protein